MFGNTNGTPFTMPVMPAGNYGISNGFGNDGYGWLWIVVLFALFGWGNGGYGFGGFGGGTGGAMQNYVLGSDFATIQRQLSDGFGSTEMKLDSVNNGICSLGYDQLGQMNGINQNISNTGYNLERAIQADTIANMQNQFAIQQGINATQTNCNNNYRSLAEQLTACCCDQKADVAQIRYDMATQNCATLTAIDKLGDRILDRMTASEIAAKDAKIAEQNCMLNNQYLLSQLQKAPIPAYVVQNPYCNCNNGYPYGYFNGTTIA